VLLSVFLGGLWPDASSAQSPDAGAPPRDRRDGLFRLGAFHLTPRLRLGPLGLDTNVFYSARERRTDFVASGGPGLEVVLPMKSRGLLTVAGGVDYLYFLRTESQRRFTGDGKARVEWMGPNTAAAEASYRSSFSRPSLEVDRRVAQQERQGKVEGRVRAGTRLDVEATASAGRIEVDSRQEFFGADLRRALSRDMYLARLTVGYRLTPKTSFLLEGDHQIDRFLVDRARDAQSNRAGAGFAVTSATRLAGKAVGGVRSFRLRRADRTTRAADGATHTPWAAVELFYRFGSRTRLGLLYSRDLQFSAFQPEGGTPTVLLESARLRLEKGLIGNLDLYLFGGLTRLATDGAIQVDLGGGELITAARDDEAWEAGADLGYTFRRHLRIGAAASYTERRSNIADFGVEGLLVGGTVTFIP
jgi:hypothetical protein